MKTANLMTIMAVLAAVAMAASEPIEVVNVCVVGTIDGEVPSRAEFKAHQILRHAGVQLIFHADKSSFCGSPIGAVIALNLSESTPHDLEPGALAYALPYEGVHVEIFCDRIRLMNNQDPSRLLAYVIVHEVTHVLQGTARHSNAGIMKARWSIEDYRAMKLGLLPLSEEDIRLIHAGLHGWSENATTAGMNRVPEKGPLQ